MVKFATSGEAHSFDGDEEILLPPANSFHCYAIYDFYSVQIRKLPIAGQFEKAMKG